MRYANCKSWSEHFKTHENILIGVETIRKRLRAAEADWMVGRDKMGRVSGNQFFSEANVRIACADLLQGLPQADESGFFHKDGTKYGTIYGWFCIFPISAGSIRGHLKKLKINSIPGRDKVGKPAKFYSENDIQLACGHLLEAMPRADESGFFEKDGIRYGHLRALARCLKTTSKTIEKKCKSDSVRSIKGKDRLGRISRFYAELDVQSAYPDLEEDFPQSKRNGFFVKNGVRYGCISAFSKRFGISEGLIKSRIESSVISSIRGKDVQGKFFNYYPEKDILDLCAEDIKPLPQADESGFFEKDGIRYGTIPALSKVIDVSGGIIRKRLKTSSISPSPIQGKNGSYRRCSYYSEDAIRELCRDLLETEFKADENGFFEKDGIRYGSIKAFSVFFGVAAWGTLSKKFKSINPPSIKGKDRSGQLVDFYSESVARDVCSDLLELPQADESGFFEKNGVRFGTVTAWSTHFLTGVSNVSLRVKKFGIKGIQGRNKYGRTFDYYSESDVRSACRDLLEKRK